MAGQVWVKKVDYKGMKVTMVESQRVGKLVGESEEKRVGRVNMGVGKNTGVYSILDS